MAEQGDRLQHPEEHAGDADRGQRRRVVDEPGVPGRDAEPDVPRTDGPPGERGQGPRPRGVRPAGRDEQRRPPARGGRPRGPRGGPATGAAARPVGAPPCRPGTAATTRATMSSGTTAYTAIQAQVTPRVTAASSAARWNLSRWTIVTTKVSAVKTNTAGTATRATVQRRALAPLSSSPTADQYDAPRKTAVIGESMVQANLVSVSRGKTKSCTPARKTSTGGDAEEPAHRRDDGIPLVAVRGSRHRSARSARCWWMAATTAAPSPTAVATRLMEPRRVSPTAKTPRRLVSSGCRTRRVSGRPGSPPSSRRVLGRCVGLGVHAHLHEAELVAGDDALEPVGVRGGADEDEEAVARRPVPLTARPVGDLDLREAAVDGPGTGHLRVVARSRRSGSRASARRGTRTCSPRRPVPGRGG